MRNLIISTPLLYRVLHHVPLTGKGLTLVASVLEGEFKDRYADSQAAKQVHIHTWTPYRCHTDIRHTYR